MLAVLGQEQGSGIAGRSAVVDRPRSGDRVEPGPLLVRPHVRLPRRQGPGGGPIPRSPAPQPPLRPRPLFHQGRPGPPPLIHLPIKLIASWILYFVLTAHYVFVDRFWRIDRILFERTT